MLLHYLICRVLFRSNFYLEAVPISLLMVIFVTYSVDVNFAIYFFIVWLYAVSGVCLEFLVPYFFTARLPMFWRRGPRTGPRAGPRDVGTSSLEIQPNTPPPQSRAIKLIHSTVALNITKTNYLCVCLVCVSSNHSGVLSVIGAWGQGLDTGDVCIFFTGDWFTCHKIVTGCTVFC